MYNHDLPKQEWVGFSLIAGYIVYFGWLSCSDSGLIIVIIHLVKLIPVLPLNLFYTWLNYVTNFMIKTKGVIWKWPHPWCEMNNVKFNTLCKRISLFKIYTFILFVAVWGLPCCVGFSPGASVPLRSWGVRASPWGCFSCSGARAPGVRLQ